MAEFSLLIFCVEILHFCYIRLPSKLEFGQLAYESTVSVEGNRFLFTGFQPARGGWGTGWGEELWDLSCSEPCSSMRPSTSLAPLQDISKTMPRSSPYPHFFLSQQCKQVSIPSGMCSCGSQSRHPLAAVLSYRIWGALSSASMWWFRETCAMLHWVMVESREAHVPRQWLPNASFREAEV